MELYPCTRDQASSLSTRLFWAPLNTYRRYQRSIFALGILVLCAFQTLVMFVKRFVTLLALFPAALAVYVFELGQIWCG